MKTNYTNQLKRNIMQDENFHCMPDNEQPKQEQSILSIVDKADLYSQRKHPNSKMVTFRQYTKEDYLAGANEMLPIIKELGEALKKVQNKYVNQKRTLMGGDIENSDYLEIQKTLDKYTKFL